MASGGQLTSTEHDPGGWTGKVNHKEHSAAKPGEAATVTGFKPLKTRNRRKGKMQNPTTNARFQSSASLKDPILEEQTEITEIQRNGHPTKSRLCGVLSIVGFVAFVQYELFPTLSRT